MNDTKNEKVSQNRQKKEKIVAKVTEKMDRAHGVVFTNYQGLTHQQLENLKKSLKKVDADLVATKNTLLLRVFGDKIDEAAKSSFSQQTATLYMYSDVIEPLKALAKSIKELKLPTIKFALLDGKILTPEDVMKLSTLAPLPVLRAQLLGGMIAPISGLHRALNWNIQKFVMTLKAVESKKTQ